MSLTPLERMSAIWRVTVDRPVATLMVVVAVGVFGWLSYGQLPVALMPELSYPTLTVRTEYEGSAPEEVEQEITKPLEEILRTVEDVVAVESRSRAGVSDVVLRFSWDTDMDFASQRVRERVDVLPLPEDSERPLLLRYDPSLDPIVRLGVRGNQGVTLAELRRFAENDIARELEKLEGVAAVRVRGGREEIVRIDLDEDAMARLDIRVEEVEQRLTAENVNLAGGQLAHGDVEYLVRTLNEFRDLGELRGMVVGRRDNRTIRLDDIAEVRADLRDREVITRIGGAESVEVAIFKEADANLVKVARDIDDALYGTKEQQKFVREGEKVGNDDKGKEPESEKERRQQEKRRELRRKSMTDYVTYALPAGVQVETLGDQSLFIEDAVSEVGNTAILGALFAIFVLYVFLRNPYTTAVIALAIPLSVVFTFAPMRLLGVTLNVMSLGGLALGIGMLVDNSVVVLESIHRCAEEGDGPRAAAIRGTKEVGSAVIASTLTTIAVFFPLSFIEGVAGQLFSDLALTVVISLVASLVVALFVVPMLASRDWSGLVSGATTPSGLTTWRRFVSWELVVNDVKAIGARWKRQSTARNLLLLPFTLVFVVYLLVRGLIVFVLELAFAKIVLGALVVVGMLLRLVVGVVVLVGRWTVNPALSGFGRAFELLAGGYRRLLRGALNHRTMVIIVAVLLMGGSLALADRLGMELIPELHQGEVSVELAMPIGTSLEETADVTARIESELDGIELVRRHSSFVGAETAATTDSDRGEHSATINVSLVPSEDVERTERAAATQIRRVLAQQPGLTYELARPTLLSLETPIAVEVRGHNLSQLRLTADAVAERMREMPEVSDVRSNLRSGYPEIRIEFDRRRLSQLGLTVRDVAEVVRRKVRGTTPSEFRRRDDRLDIEMRVRRDQISDIDDLRNLIVAQRAAGGAIASPMSGSGGSLEELAASASEGAALSSATGSNNRTGPVIPIKLGSVANVEVAEGPSEIRHVDGQRAAVVEADSTSIDLQTVVERLEKHLAPVPIPPGMAVTIGGQNEELETARRSLLFALLLAVFLVYIVMASQFESIVAPFVIIFTVPLALIGVTGALWLTSSPLSVVVFIGLIMLTGIVVNNAIVLVDYVIQLRGRGMDPTEAVVEACGVRLRPVLITTLTTVLGLLPMALGLGEGAEVRRPMALTVIAGLSSSTLLTLVVVPVVYHAVATLRPVKPAPQHDETSALAGAE